MDISVLDILGISKRFHSVQVILVHMDEKWFFAFVARRNLKMVPALGITPVVHRIQHKSHIDKTMGIVSTEFIPQGNDLTAGGKAVKVSFVQVGRFQPAARDTF